ncbi:MAG TPA: G1 family glutamic endopeptidase, partial [Pseudonocardiaceae bacterium]|nr:G1 family glutamic endopeptidase [Pseudonocardiaceae bacterium]
MKTHLHATPARRRRPGLLALAALPFTLAAVIGLMLGVSTANYSKDRMFPVLNRARRSRLGIIGALTVLPLILMASPANAATGGTDAPQATHVPHLSGGIGPARGKKITHKSVSPKIPDGSASSSTGDSFDWDGYTVLNSSGTNTTSFNRVSAQWTQPTITCDPSNPNIEWGSFWVGLDGWLSSSVEQAGTEAYCVNGVPGYYVWWEMYPYNLIQHAFRISPGDVIQASITYNTSTSEFEILVKDVTSNQTLTQNMACQSGQANCARSSAEVISEPVGGGNDRDGMYYLPNYGTTTFTNVSVTDVNGHTGSLNDPTWNSVAITEVSSAGVTKQTVGPLSTDGTSFTTTWQHGSGA